MERRGNRVGEEGVRRERRRGEGYVERGEEEREVEMTYKERRGEEVIQSEERR